MPKRLNDDQIRRNLRQAEIRKADAGYSKRVLGPKLKRSKEVDSQPSFPNEPQIIKKNLMVTPPTEELGVSVRGGWFPIDEESVVNAPANYTNIRSTMDSWESMDVSNSIEDEYFVNNWPIVYDKKASVERMKASSEVLKVLFARDYNPAAKPETEYQTKYLSAGSPIVFGPSTLYQNIIRWIDPRITMGCPEGAILNFSSTTYSLAKSTLLRMMSDAADAGINVGNLMVDVPFPLDYKGVANITMNSQLSFRFIESWVVVYAKGQLDTLYSGSYMSSASPKQNTKKETAKVVAGQRAITLEEEV